MSLTFRSRQWLPIALRVRSRLRPASLPAPAKLKDSPFREEPPSGAPAWPGSPLEGLSHSSLSPHFQAQAWPSTGCQYRYAAGPDSQVDLPGAQGGPRGTTLLPITAWGWQTDTQQPHGTRHAGKRQRGQSLDGGTQLTTPQAKPFEPKTQG